DLALAGTSKGVLVVDQGPGGLDHDLARRQVIERDLLHAAAVTGVVVVDAEGGEAVRDGHGLHVWLWGLPTLAAAQRRRHARGNQGGCYPSLLEGERAAREPGPGHAAGPTLSPTPLPDRERLPGTACFMALRRLSSIRARPAGMRHCCLTRRHAPLAQPPARLTS